MLFTYIIFSTQVYRSKKFIELIKLRSEKMFNLNQIIDIRKIQIANILNVEKIIQILDLINSFSDCFVKEFGKIKAIEEITFGPFGIQAGVEDPNRHARDKMPPVEKFNQTLQTRGVEFGRTHAGINTGPNRLIARLDLGLVGIGETRRRQRGV